jgi:hypothetical protein
MDFNTFADIPRRKAIWILILIIIFAAGLRLWVISRTVFPAGDGAGSNMELAVNLLDGKGWESERKWTYFGPWGEWGAIPHPEGNQQPLTSVLVAGAILVGGVNYHSGQAVVFLLSLSSLILLYVWAAKRFNRKVALIAAAVGAISASQIWFGANLDTQVAFQLVTLIFFLLALTWLPDKAKNRLKLRYAFILGLITGFAYLTRANGAFLLAGLWFWLLFWGGDGKPSTDGWLLRFIKHLLFIAPAVLISLLGFCVAVLPWWIRNWQVFGSPFYTQNAYFIYAEDFYNAWTVRPSPPSAAEWFSHHNLWENLIREGRGIYAAMEPFFLGNIHRIERYAEGPLIVFTLMGAFWMLRRGELRKDVLPLMILGMHFIGLAAHFHAFRYLLPFYLLTYAYGAAGLLDVWQDLLPIMRKKMKRLTITLAGCLTILLVISPMGRPLAQVLFFDDRPFGKDIFAAADYLASNTKPDQVIADFPKLENIIWYYHRPTIAVPYDPANTILAVLDAYKPAFLFVTPELIKERVGVDGWFGLSDEGRVIEKNPPANWHRVWTNENGRMVIYKLDW